MMTSSNS